MKSPDKDSFLPQIWRIPFFSSPEFGQGKSRGEGWKKWAQFMGKWPLQDVLLVSLDDHHIYLKFISGNKWFCAQDIVLLNCLFSKNAMHHPKVHFQYKCFLTRLLWKIGLGNIMTPILNLSVNLVWIFLDLKMQCRCRNHQQLDFKIHSPGRWPARTSENQAGENFLLFSPKSPGSGSGWFCLLWNILSEFHLKLFSSLQYCPAKLGHPGPDLKQSYASVKFAECRMWRSHWY